MATANSGPVGGEFLGQECRPFRVTERIGIYDAGLKADLGQIDKAFRRTPPPVKMTLHDFF